MANKVFVFCIGGTGLRVMKAITMLAAAGAKANGYDIVPIIVDPHVDLEEKTRLDNLINNYISIYKSATASEGQQMNPLDGFFNTQFLRLTEIDDEQNNTSANMAERRTFGEYMNVGNLRNDDVNNFFVQTLFSKENLDNSLAVGFKGNPNIGTVVLNEMVNGADWYSAFTRHCEQGDRVFIISSIFGGTGASGYPLMEKKIRDAEGFPNVQRAVMGAVTVLPYYSLADPAVSGSDIDSSSFFTKSKSALSYYEGTVKSDYLYYAGEQTLRASYKNNEKEQKNDAHFVELVAATALFDFLSKDKPDSPQALTRAIEDDKDALDLTSLGDGYRSVVKNVADMMLLNLLVQILPEESQFPLKKGRKMNGDFYRGHEFCDLDKFAKEFSQWYKELADNKRGFTPLNLVGPGKELTAWVKGNTLKGKDESYYLLEMIKASNKGNGESHENIFRYFLDFAYKAINVYTKSLLK